MITKVNDSMHPAVRKFYLELYDQIIEEDVINKTFNAVHNRYRNLSLSSIEFDVKYYDPRPVLYACFRTKNNTNTKICIYGERDMQFNYILKLLEIPQAILHHYEVCVRGMATFHFNERKSRSVELHLPHIIRRLCVDFSENFLDRPDGATESEYDSDNPVVVAYQKHELSSFVYKVIFDSIIEICNKATKEFPARKEESAVSTANSASEELVNIIKHGFFSLDEIHALINEHYVNSIHEE